MVILFVLFLKLNLLSSFLWLFLFISLVAHCNFVGCGVESLVRVFSFICVLLYGFYYSFLYLYISIYLYRAISIYISLVVEPNEVGTLVLYCYLLGNPWTLEVFICSLVYSSFYLLFLFFRYSLFIFYRCSNWRWLNYYYDF
jgi:hypothetical protein